MTPRLSPQVRRAAERPAPMEIPRLDPRWALARATGKKKQLLAVLTAFRKGNFNVRLRSDLTGIDGKIADTLNDVIELNERLADEPRRVSQVVGDLGRIGQRASLGSLTGAWAASIDSPSMRRARPRKRSTGSTRRWTRCSRTSPCRARMASS